MRHIGFKKSSWMLAFCLAVSALPSIGHAAPIAAETRAKLESLRTSIRTWAPMKDGHVALSREGYQFDMIEFTGFRCATGDLERCGDIAAAQDPTDGRWWRVESLIGKSKADSFSRDMFMGLMLYFATTKDTERLKKWLHYLDTHKNKMCDDASDNRCSLLPTTWGMLGHLKEYLGMKRSNKEALGATLLQTEMLASALTAPKGFQLMLAVDNLFFLRKIGFKKDWMDTVAKLAYRRQPDNPMIRYLVFGQTEELAQDVLKFCPEKESERMDDIFWQRELGRNSEGELIVIRDDWGRANTRIPVRTMADGHDCLVLLNLLIDHPL